MTRGWEETANRMFYIHELGQVRTSAEKQTNHGARKKDSFHLIAHIRLNFGILHVQRICLRKSSADHCRVNNLIANCNLQFMLPNLWKKTSDREHFTLSVRIIFMNISVERNSINLTNEIAQNKLDFVDFFPRRTQQPRQSTTNIEMGPGKCHIIIEKKRFNKIFNF